MSPTERRRRFATGPLALAALILGGSVFFACSSRETEAKAPAQEAAATEYPQAGAPPEQYPAYRPNGQSTAAPAPTYASPADATNELDFAEKKLDLAIDSRDAMGQPLASGVDRCSIVCDALASMRRAADHVCQLDASRCGDVKVRVSRAEERAKSACPACVATPT
jgi:hypothetical protein